MNAKVSVFVICVEAIIYFLLYNLHDCTFNPLCTKMGRHIKNLAVNAFKVCLTNMGRY